MKIVDIAILVTLFLFAVVGFKRGFFKSLVMFFGVILVLVLSYTFKNYLGDFFTLNLPFFKFGQFLGGAVTLNVVMYQTIAFLIMMTVFSLAYGIIVVISGIFEKILKMTILLGIPSKLLGLLVGALEGTIIIYVVLFFISQPFVNINLGEYSDYANPILTKTPFLSSYMNKTIEIIEDVKDISKEENDIDLKITDLILKNNVTSKEVMQKLVESGKIKVDGIQEVINKYN